MTLSTPMVLPATPRVNFFQILVRYFFTSSAWHLLHSERWRSPEVFW